MAIRVQTVQVTIGKSVPLRIAQREDRAFRLVITDPLTSQPFDFTNAAVDGIRATVRDSQGLLIFARLCPIVGSPTAGTVDFVVGGTDTDGQPVQPYLWDLQSLDTSGYNVQPVVASVFDLLEAVGADGDPVSPAPIPIVGPFDQTFTGSGATPVPVGLFNLPDGKAAVALVRCVVKRASTGDVASFVRRVTVKNFSGHGGPLIVNSPPQELVIADADPAVTGWDFAITIDGAGNVIGTFTGDSGNTAGTITIDPTIT